MYIVYPFQFQNGLLGQMHKCLVLVNLKKISADNFALLHTYSR